MSKVVTTVNQIDNQILTYTPAVIAGVQAAEAAGGSGQAKLQAVINGIQAGSAGLAGAPSANVAAVAGLVNLVVSIFNALGVFKRSPQLPAGPVV